MLQVCAHLRIHPYRYHGGDSGTTRKGPCAPRRRIVLRQRLPAAAAAVPGKQGRARSATRRGGGPWRRAGPAAARRARGRARLAPPRAMPPRRRAVAAAVTCSRRTVAAPSRCRARPLRARRRAITASAVASAFACSSSRPRGEGNRQSPAAPARTRKGGDAQRVSSVLPVAGENKASLPSLAYLSIGDVNRERGAGYVDLA